MVFKDNDQNRMMFWIAYCCYIGLLTSYELYYWFVPLPTDEELWTEKIALFCTTLGETDGWGVDGSETNPYFEYGECIQEEKHDMTRNKLVKIVLPMYVQLYFCFVIFTHYKNASLPKSKGGCIPDPQPISELNNVRR